MAQHYGGFSIGDYSKEKSSVKVYNGPITAGTIAGFLTQFGALRTAIEGIIKGTVMNERWVGDDTLLSSTYPSDGSALRELKWLVSYTGNTNNNLYQLEIPTADMTLPRLPGTDYLDLTQTAAAAFVTAFEAIAKSPDDDTEAVTIRDIKLVGRNL